MCRYRIFQRSVEVRRLLVLAAISALFLSNGVDGADQEADQGTNVKPVAHESGTSPTEEPEGSSHDKSGKLIVHEWGTFTSFSGSNGVQLDFRPLADVDLPDFVFDRNLQEGTPNFSKRRVRARVRMETPVTYFYTDQERTVRASVEFPDGLLTEFYPPVVALLPKTYSITSDQPRVAGGKLDWGEIHLIPVHKLAPHLKDAQTKDWLHRLIVERILPNGGPPNNHYYHARETDSAFVHVRAADNADLPARLKQDFIEKFLFYRGVGKFDQPLQVVVDESGHVRVKNKSPQPIRSLIRVTVEGQSITVSELEHLAASQSVDFPIGETQMTSVELQEIVVKALIRENLYPREALAMVKTWADSWFAEQGTRIFYMVPREVTDRLLPLTISPTPDESVRVLVGRVEVMSPSVEQNLLEVIRLRAAHHAALARRNAEKEVNEPIILPIPNPIKKLGRLAEPALVRLHQLAKDNAVSDEAAILLREFQAVIDDKAPNGDSISANSE